MKKLILFLLMWVASSTIASGQLLSPAPDPQPPAPTLDLLILHGRLYDGTGNPWRAADVGIRGGRIAALGKLAGASARRLLDARGMAVAPGFIDMHSHSDYALLVDGRAENRVRQGVTTEVFGEHISAAPLEGAAVPLLHQWLAGLGGLTLKPDWTDFPGYFRRLERQGISVNVASYVASGMVRAAVIGDQNRPATPAELERMRGMVETAMRQGALGLSSGLIYTPNRYADVAELAALADVAARYGGIYASHIRNEGAGYAEAVGEAVEIGRRARIPVHIFHFKLGGKSVWGRMAEQVKLIEAARAEGVEVTADQYPYTAGMTLLEIVIPPKYREGGQEKFLARLRDPAVRAAIRRDLAPESKALALDGAGGVPGWESPSAVGWDRIMLASATRPENKPYEGRRISEIAAGRRQDPLDAVADLLLSENSRCFAIYFQMDERDVTYAMRQPWVSVGSDGAAGPTAGKPHPRFYGAFPRLLGKYVREEKLLTLEEALRKMTSLAAQQAGLADRGLLRPGFAADMVVFDPATVADRATYENPEQFPVGIEYVVVNGQLVVDRGRHTGARPGRVLRGPGYAAAGP